MRLHSHTVTRSHRDSGRSHIEPRKHTLEEGAHDVSGISAQARPKLSDVSEKLRLSAHPHCPIVLAVHFVLET
jgi:hypothetical protein